MTTHFKKTVFLAINIAIASTLLASAGVASAWWGSSDTFTSCVGGGWSCGSDKIFSIKKDTRIEVFGHCDRPSSRSDGLRGVIKFVTNTTDGTPQITNSFPLQNSNSLGGLQVRFKATGNGLSYMTVECYNRLAKATGQTVLLGSI